MSTSRDPDQQFHDNLSLLAGRVDVPDGASPDVLDRCDQVLGTAQQAAHWRILNMMRKPTVLSGLGVAASIALAVTLLLPSHGEPAVHAAMIMEKLDEQIKQNPLVEITLDSLAIEEVVANGHLWLSDQAIAGQLSVKVNEEDDLVIDVDLSVGISDEGGWVLLRKLTLSDPDVQPLVNLIFPSGSETLLLLPAEHSEEALAAGFSEGLEEFHSQHIKGLLQALIDSHADYGATLEEQPDGTILLTIPIKDAEALQALARLAESTLPAKNVTVSVGMGGHHGLEVSAEAAEGGDTVTAIQDEHMVLVGSTLTVVYDPATERVRSFAIDNLGTANGSISVVIGEGEVDPDLLDSSRVAGPDVRTLDLGALEALAKKLEH